VTGRYRRFDGRRGFARAFVLAPAFGFARVFLVGLAPVFAFGFDARVAF
jgi:hypothetical protein